ncbi:hypothetical protein [Bacillus sp. JCM 19041]|uniref:hypothetical protein n=1 Tax=Bacillus sp. JCM 19041 TaxID=1460637 RepID=UPI000B0317D5
MKRKNKWKSTANVTIMGITIMTMAACNDEGASNETTDGPVTFTLFSSDPHSQWDNMQSPVSQKVIEETGVTINPEFDVNGGEQKIALMAASGDYPDFILPKGSASTLVNAGAFIDLTDLIEEHGPNLKKIYGDYFNRLKWSEEDEGIYILQPHL